MFFPAYGFDRAWALTCLTAAMRLLEAEYSARGRDALFQSLRPFLDPESEGDYAAVAGSAGLEHNALRQAVFRIRQRYRTLVRQTIADTLAHPSDALIDEELTALRAALAC